MRTKLTTQETEVALNCAYWINKVEGQDYLLDYRSVISSSAYIMTDEEATKLSWDDKKKHTIWNHAKQLYKDGKAPTNG